MHIVLSMPTSITGAVQIAFAVAPGRRGYGFPPPKASNRWAQLQLYLRTSLSCN